MMQAMHRMAQTWVFKGLSVLLVFSFAIWGIGDMFRNNPQQSKIASVGKVEITVGELERDFKLDLPEARKALGADLTEQQAREIGWLERTLRMMVENALLDQVAQKSGLDVSQEAMTAYLIRQFPQAADQNGKLDLAKLDKGLNKSGIAREFFFALQRREIARQVIVDIVARGATAPSFMTDNMYKVRGEKRVVDVVALRDDSITSIPAPDDKALVDFYDKNKQTFARPEYRSLTIAALTTDALRGEVTPSEEDVRKEYESRTAELTLPERRDISQVVLKEEKAAKALYDQVISRKKGLSDAAAAAGKAVVKLDKVDEKSISSELYATVFALDEGQVSPPLRSPFGWHVVEVRKIYPAGKSSFEEAAPSLRDALIAERLPDVMTKTITRLEDTLAAGKSLEDIAEAFGLRLTKITAVNAEGVGTDGKPVATIPDPRNAVPLAFAQSAGETGQVMDDGKGGYMIIRTDNIQPEQIPPLEQIKAAVTAAWQQQQRMDKASAMIEQIAVTLREGKSPAKLAVQPGVEVRVSRPISALGDVDRELPEDFMSKILAMQKKGDVITAAAMGRHYALRLAEIVAAPVAVDESSRLRMKKLDDRLTHDLRYDLLVQYAHYLRQEHPVEINDSLLESVKGKSVE